MVPVRKSRPRLRVVSEPSPPPPPAPSLDDAQLLSALRGGDKRAASSLHDRVRPVVDRTVARLLGRGDSDREDLAQLTMIELVTTIDRFRGECSLDSWTSMVAARVVFKHIRRRKTERRIFERVMIDDDDAPSTRSATRQLAARSLIGRIHGHLAALDPVKSWTVLLHDVWGYDLREIAQITGTSVSAAQTRLTRGRRDLHERITTDPELVDWLEHVEGES